MVGAPRTGTSPQHGPGGAGPPRADPGYRLVPVPVPPLPLLDFPAPAPPVVPHWRPTSALIRAAVLSVATLGLSLGLGRADLAAIGAPVVLGLVMALSARNPNRAGVPTSSAEAIGEVRAGRVATLDVEVRGVDGAQFVTVAVPDVHRGPIGGSVTIPGGSPAHFPTLVKAPRWGTVTMARPDVSAAGADGLWEIGPVIAPETAVAVRPDVQRIDPLELPAILGGWAGDHVSRRPGQGGDLIDLREYVPGDRLRSIHWRAYARHQKLFVRRTQSDADAEFVLCLDTRADVRPQRRAPRTAGQRFLRLYAGRFRRLGQFARGLILVEMPTEETDSTPRSSLDLAVEAAAAIASAQLKAGDRVGVLDLSTYRRHVRMGTGTRHLERIRHQLAGMDLVDTPWLVRAELWGLPASAVVVIISPLTDEAVLTAATDCRARGHHVLVVDALPVGGLRAMAAHRTVEVQELALLLAERDLRLDQLRRHAIPIVSWEAGNITTALRALRRATRERR